MTTISKTTVPYLECFVEIVAMLGCVLYDADPSVIQYSDVMPEPRQRV